MSWLDKLINAGPPPLPVKPPKKQLEDSSECLLDKPIKAGPPPLPVKPPKKQLEDSSKSLPPTSPSGNVDQIVKTFDTKLLKSTSPSQPPSYSSENLQTQNELKGSTPPPLLPRKRVALGSEQSKTDHEYVELIKEDTPVKARPPPLPKKFSDDTKTLPHSPVSSSEKLNQMVTLKEKQLKYNSPPQSPTYQSDVNQRKLNLPPPPLFPRKRVKQDSEEYENIKDSTLSDSYEAMTPWSDVCRTLKLKESPEAVIIDEKAELLYKAIRLYNQLMTEQGGKLKELITELHSIASDLDKFLMGTRIAGLTGVATSVAGGLTAAAAGVILSPFTAGTSLVTLTAVGVSVAAAGGITRVSASVANQANSQKINKKIDKTLQDFDDICKNVLGWLKFIREGMKLLRQHDLSVLKKIARNSKRMANLVKLITGDSSDMDSLSARMDCYFTDGKHRLKKSVESNFATNLCRLAEDLDKGLSELINIKDMLIEFDDDSCFF